MAVPPTTDWLESNLPKTLNSATFTITSGESPYSTLIPTNDRDLYGHINILTGTFTTSFDAIRITTTTVPNRDPLRYGTLVKQYTSITFDDTCTFTKSSTVFYLWFLFITGTTTSGTIKGGLRLDLSSFGTGTYTLYMGGVGVNCNSSAYVTFGKIVSNIMITNGTTQYDWNAMHAPIAYAGDFSETSGFRDNGGVILYNTATGKGHATVVNGQGQYREIECPIWGDVTTTYINNQGVRYCDIDRDNICIRTITT
jgi:hypothetical protein